MTKNPKFSLILPIYNEGAILEESINKIVDQLKKLPYDYEIIFIEDRSTDGTTKKLRQLLPNIAKSSAIFHSRNTGRGKTVVDGIYKSKGDIVGFIDVDLEISERYIPSFIEKVREGYDLVVADRIYEKNFWSITRVIASTGYQILVKLLLNLPITDSESGYKFFNKETILPVVERTQDTGWFWDTEVCALANKDKLKIAEIEVDFIRKSNKKSTVRLFSDGTDYLLKLIPFSFRTRL